MSLLEPIPTFGLCVYKPMALSDGSYLMEWGIASQEKSWSFLCLGFYALLEL